MAIARSDIKGHATCGERTLVGSLFPDWPWTGRAFEVAMLLGQTFAIARFIIIATSLVRIWMRPCLKVLHYLCVWMMHQFIGANFGRGMRVQCPCPSRTVHEVCVSPPNKVLTMFEIQTDKREKEWESEYGKLQIVKL
jgi:hypothetical protein